MNDITNFVKKADFNNKLKDFANENETNEISEKAKAISTKELTTDLINKFSAANGEKYFPSEYFEITQYLCQLKNTLLVVLLGLIRRNLMEGRRKY